MNYGLGVARRGELGGAVKWKAVCHGSQALGLGGEYKARTFNREQTGPCVGGYTDVTTNRREVITRPREGGGKRWGGPYI